MQRASINLLAVTHLLLWAAIIAGSFYTQSTQAVFSLASGGYLVRCHVKENGLVFAVIDGWPVSDGLSVRSGPAGAPGFGVPVVFDKPSFQNRTLLGISSQSGHGVTAGGSPVHGSAIIVPWLWPQILATILSIPACFRVSYLYRLWQRRSRGLCPECGYDVRGISGQCPECGTAPDMAHFA